jgi:hypothetical protein
MATVALVEENKWAELQYLPVYILPPQVIPYSPKMVTGISQHLADYRHHIPPIQHGCIQLWGPGRHNT